jgi:predicted enzyme related to lactoylglutathione lyase
MPHPVVHFEILGRDQKLLEEFYKSVFNWEITPVEDWYSLVKTGVPGDRSSSSGWKSGAGINGGIGAREQHTGHVTFYVAVADIAAALALIESKGGKTAFGPHPIPDGALIAGFTDPEGHLIGLVQGPAGM